MKEISVIIPVYNTAPYIVECLDSLAAQTFNDLEVILVDDCGTDDSMAIAEKYISEYDGPIEFRILHQEHNSGVAESRNHGIDEATGRFISYLDSDDYIAPETFERMHTIIQEGGDKVYMVACCCNAVVDGEVRPILWNPAHQYRLEPEDYAEKMLLRESPHMSGGKLIRREALGGTRFRKGRNVEDWLFHLDFYRTVEKEQYVTIVIPDRFYYYRQHSTSVVHNYSFVLTDFANWQDVLSDIKANKPSIYGKLHKRYIGSLLRKCVEAAPRSAGMHTIEKDLHAYLDKVSLADAFKALDFRSVITFAGLRYCPGIYKRLTGKN